MHPERTVRWWAPLVGSQGSAGIEWIGMLVVAALVIGSAATAAVRSQGQVQDATRDLVCRVLAHDQDRGCSDAGTAAATSEGVTEQQVRDREVGVPQVRPQQARVAEAAPGPASGPVSAAARERTMAVLADGVATPPTLGGTRAATPDAGVVPMTECAGPTTAPPVTSSEADPDGGVVVTTTTIETTVCTGPAGGVRDCTRTTETVSFSDGFLGPQDFEYQMQCGAPRLPAPVGYPGEAACADPVGGTTTSRRACLQPDGQVSSCTGIPVPVPGDVAAPVWFCHTGSLPAAGFDACSDLGDSSAMCTVGDTVLRCFQPRDGAVTSTADYARCWVPGPGDPLTDPVVVQAVQAGADADAVLDACDAVVAASAEATAEVEDAYGAPPRDDDLLKAELEATMDVLDQYLLASTGYDPGVPAQREAYQAQLSGAHLALQGQPAGSPLAGSEQAFDAASVGTDAAHTRLLQLGGGEPGARCRSTAVWLFVATGTLVVSQGERLGMDLSQRLTFTGAWGLASAAAFWLREQYESQMREYNSVPGTRLPTATALRRRLGQTLTVARAFLTSFGLPRTAPSPAMQPSDWDAVYPPGDIEMEAFNPTRVNQAGQVWQAQVNAQGQAQAPVAMFLPPGR